jgi:hypothetical protein
MRTIRVVAWVVLVTISVFQAYAHRYAVSPDGISYLDMSDAMVGGDWSRLVNLYWSPLYPALIGVARAVIGTSPAREIPAIHLVNFASFVAMFVAFEYMLTSILELASRTRRSILAGPWGLAGAYGLFAFFALTMLPQELSTPDLLSGATMFTVFGALLRLRAGGEHETRHAVVLGVALGLGALAKSFMVPWALVCLVVLAMATRSRGFRATLIAGAVWAVIVLPWTVVLTRHAGRFTFGDTGRLTYAWYVNRQDAPSAGGVPLGARTAATESILPGVGATGPAPGTDPMWFDPAHWNAMIAPHWNLQQQLGTFTSFQLFYVQSLTPLLFLILLVVTSPPGTRRHAWWNGWVVYVPAVAGTVAYSLVLVTARYVMPFLLAGMLTLLATLPRPRRMMPLMAMLGIAVPIGLESTSNDTTLGLVLVTASVAAMTIGAVVPTRSRLLWGFVVVAGFALAHIFLPPSAPDVVRMGSVLIAVLFWLTSRAAIRTRHPIRFAQRATTALVLVLTIVFALRLERRFRQDATALRRASSAEWGNVPLKIAEHLASEGVGPGTSIALIGPHAESYWARSGRLKIVANVPRTRVSAFWQLSPASRDSLLQLFAAAGATVAVASMGPEGAAPDASWTPVRYRGWIRRLTR